MKSAAIQAATGVLQPAFLAPLASFMFATRHFTFRMPLPLSQPREFAKFYYKLSKPLMAPMAVIAGLHVLLAFIITHLELSDLHYLQAKMMEGVPEDALPPKPKAKTVVETL